MRKLTNFNDLCQVFQFLTTRVHHKIFEKSESLEHAIAKMKVAEHYRALGYKVTLEYKFAGGRAADVVVEKDGKRIAIEIETGKSDSLYNIRKDLEAGFEEIIVVAVDSLSLDTISKNVFIQRFENIVKIKSVCDFQ